ncbi:glutathione S-transferase family protein [Jannaschia marina]|uniref:glutathione S-transferase family protein n=1 Tax=Jannaschia marina TaxID=2741674 RepID=UPI0015CC5ABC|nr:glutathione S-transferase family protein [Jannaschia marina]
MPTLYHSPNSRSSTIVALIEEMDIADRVDIVTVDIRRRDGSGAPDPRNPHPEKKVPYLTIGDDHVRERGAIVTVLTDMFADAGLGRPVGDPQRGAFLGWLFYYQGVMEPVLVHSWAGLDHPALRETFRDLDAVLTRLAEALDGQPYLLGTEYSAVDLLLSSPFQWMPDTLPDVPVVRAWVERCAARPAVRSVTDRERALL